MHRLKSHPLVVQNQFPVRAMRPSWLLLGFAFLIMIIITACSSASTEVPPTPGPISDEALMAAVESSNVAEVKRLLEGGADPNYKQDGTLVMFVAVNRGNLDILKLLVEHDGHVYGDNLPNILQSVNPGYPVTDTEAELFNYLLDQVIAQGGDVDQVDYSGGTALFWATVNDNHGLMQLLVDNGAEINRPNNEGSTALMVASFHGRLETVRQIVKLGADVNYLDTEGMTAIFDAARGGHVEVVQFLIESGARVDIKNEQDDTALDYAKANKNDEIILLLQEAGADE